MRKDRKGGYFDPLVECMTAEERRAFRSKNLEEALENAFATSPFMEKKLRAAGIREGSVRGVGDLQGVPLTRKAEFRDLQQNAPPFGGIPGCDLPSMRRVYVSPGPIYDPEGRGKNHWRWEKPLFAAGFRKGDLVQNTFAYHMTPAGHMFDSALNRLGCTVIPAGVGNRELQVQVMRELPVSGYVGTPSFLFSILAKADEMGVGKGDELGLEVALVTGEKFTEAMREDLKELGIIARQCYGTADVGAIAYECSEGRGLHISDDLILEVVDPGTGNQVEEGGTGEVAVTLNSPVYPLVRFGTGDLSFVTTGDCPCGRTSKRLGGIVGRIDQLTKVRGMFIHPSQVVSLESRYPGIQEVQVIVERVGHEDLLSILVSTKEGFTPGEDFKINVEDAAREIFNVRGEVIFVESFEEEGKKIFDKREWGK
jgi:phenylacetate-CoA ligase